MIEIEIGVGEEIGGETGIEIEIEIKAATGETEVAGTSRVVGRHTPLQKRVAMTMAAEVAIVLMILWRK